MEDIHISTDANTTGSATPDSAKPTGSPPAHQSPIDQTMAAARKVLAMITGRAKS
jgi:hypothetical protein